MKVVAIAALVLLIGSSAPGVRAQGESQIIQRILVKVNGEIFTQTDLVQRQLETIRDKKIQVTGAADLQNERLKTTLIEITPALLVDVVDELLLVQRGRELGFRMTEEQFKGIVDNLKKEFKLDDAGLKAGLAQEGLTMESYRRITEYQLIIRQVTQQEIMSRQQLTDEEARQYYDKHLAAFMAPATMTLKEILVTVATEMRDGKPSFSVGSDDDAKEKVTAARERAVKGEDYGKLVQEVSDSPSKAFGGTVGPVNLGDMDPALRAVLEKLAQSEISQPYRTPKGYAIYKVESKTESQAKPFAAVHDEIAQKIYEGRVSTETQKYLAKLRVQALIEWKDDSMRKAYEKALAERTVATK